MGFGLAGIGALLTGGSIATATANESGGLDAVFGRKPEVAPFVPIDLMAEVGKATDANLSNADKIEELLNRIVPGFSDMLAKGSKSTLALLSGEIPEDVQDKVYRDSAYKALMGGYAGSGMSKALTARDIGRTSLDMLGLGANSAQLWSGLAQKSFSPFTVTAMQQAQATAANNAGKQATDQFRFNVEAAPDPGAAGTFAIDSAIGMQMMNLGMAMGTAAMAGGGSSGGNQAGKYAQYASMMNGGGGGYQYYGQTSGQSPHYQYNPSTGSFIPIAAAAPAWGG